MIIKYSVNQELKIYGLALDGNKTYDWIKIIKLISNDFETFRNRRPKLKKNIYGFHNIFQICKINSVYTLFKKHWPFFIKKQINPNYNQTVSCWDEDIVKLN